MHHLLSRELYENETSLMEGVTELMKGFCALEFTPPQWLMSMHSFVFWAVNKKQDSLLVLNLVAHLSPHFCCIHSISVLVSLGAQTCWKSMPLKLRPLQDFAPSWGRSSFWGAHQHNCSLYFGYFPESQLHCYHLHYINFDRLHQTGSISDVE